MDSSTEVVIITGASGGVGRALAIGFCGDGATVVGLARNEQNLLETAGLCQGGQIDTIVGDVGSEADVDRLFSHTLGRYGKVDVLINNAAIYPKKLLVEMSPRDWSEVMDTNVLGPVMCFQRALPRMMERSYGRIINLGSFAGRVPIPSSSAYSVSKAAMICLTKAMVVEIDRAAYPNILVNELSPPGVRSGMHPGGRDPKIVYPQVRFMVDLPAGGPTGRIFVNKGIHHEDYGIRARIRRKIDRIRGKPQWEF